MAQCNKACTRVKSKTVAQIRTSKQTNWLWQQQKIKEPVCANNRGLDPDEVAATEKSLLCMSTIAGSAAADDQL